jgi:hypothetical protein
VGRSILVQQQQLGFSMLSLKKNSGFPFLFLENIRAFLLTTQESGELLRRVLFECCRVIPPPCFFYN